MLPNQLGRYLKGKFVKSSECVVKLKSSLTQKE